MDVELIVRELDKSMACDLGYADGDAEETNEYFLRFGVRGSVADLLIPNRPPDLIPASSDGHSWWWTLPDGTIINRSYYDNDAGWVYIIPPDAGDPPSVKGYHIPAWVPAD